jgi:hypothetical protein
VKNDWELMTKVADQLGTLGVTEATVKEQAESDPRVIADEILRRYHELVKASLRPSGKHLFMKLHKQAS